MQEIPPFQQLTQEIGCQTADKVNANCSLIAKWDVREVKDASFGPNIHHIISLNQKLWGYIKADGKDPEL